MNNEMIDEQCLAWRGRRLGQLAVVCQHINEAGFAYIGTSDESILWLLMLWALADELAALDVGGVLDGHGLVGKMSLR